MHISKSLLHSPECSSGLPCSQSPFTTHMVSMAIITKVAVATPLPVGSQEISVVQIFSVNKLDSPLVKLLSNAQLVP